jgi:hypothetical protein
MIIRCLIAACAVACFALTTAAQTVPAAKGTASISGRVMLGDRPAVNVQVVVRSPERTMYGGRAVIARTNTDSDGRYRFANLPAGKCAVAPKAPAHIVTGRKAGDFVDYGESLVLEENEAIKDINFNLVRGGVITGRVTDAEGRPVIGETVYAQTYVKHEPDKPGAIGETVERTTDDRGIYRFYGLAVGSYVVSCGRGEASPTTETFSFSLTNAFYQRQYYPASPTLDEAGTIEVASGSEASNIDLHLGKLMRAFRVAGRVVNADGGVPKERSYLSVNPVKGEGPAGSPGFALVEESGEFAVQGLDAGTYEIVVPQTSGDDLTFPKTKIEIVDADLENIVIKAERGLTVKGAVVVENTSSGPLPFRLNELNLYASTTGGEGGESSSSGARIAPDGSFSIGGLRPGRFRLSTYSILPGIYPRSVERSGVPQTGVLDAVPTDPPVPSSIVLSAELPVNDLTVRIAYGNCQVRGTVALADGTLPAAASVNISYRRNAGSEREDSISPDARGRFILRGLLPGEYIFTVTAYDRENHGWSGTATATVRNDADNTVTVTIAPATGSED